MSYTRFRLLFKLRSADLLLLTVPQNNNSTEEKNILVQIQWWLFILPVLLLGGSALWDSCQILVGIYTWLELGD